MKTLHLPHTTTAPRRSKNFRRGYAKTTRRALIPTAECPPYPEGLAEAQQKMPVPELTDREVDALLRLLVQRGGGPATIPDTQYGRRTVIASAIALAQHSRPEK
jgi:hypothetical protein